MRGALLGLDLGEKRIGVAFVQAGTTIAFAAETIEVRGREQVVAQIQKLILQYKAEKVVVGLPKTLRNEMGIAAQKRVQEVAWYQSRITEPMVMWDERLSSKEVERMLIDADVRRDKRKEVIDKLAAQRILQNYLDSTIANS